MNIKKLLARAKERGINELQVTVSHSTKFSFKIFHSEVEDLKKAEDINISLLGIYEGKLGGITTTRNDDKVIDHLLDVVIASAKANEKAMEIPFFKGSDKYRKRNVFNRELASISSKEKIDTLLKVEKALASYDKRVSEVTDLSYSEVESADEFYNSSGLTLKQKSNYFYILGGVVMKEGEEVKTNYDIFLGSDLKAFNQDEFVSRIGEGAKAKFGGTQCPSGKYPTVIRNDVFADLLDYFVSQTSSEEIQKQSSLLMGKLGQKVASSKVTIDEKPLAKNVFFSYFDAEGVAKQNKTLIKRGVLQTYLYNRETAKKEGVKTTGNASFEGGKFGISYSNLFVKPGKKTFEEMISTIKEGVYITEIAGLGTGMNARSGDFSCQAQGFMIRNGKLAEPLNLITLSGNLLKMFVGIKELDNNLRLQLNASTVPDILVKKLSIGGK